MIYYNEQTFEDINMSKTTTTHDNPRIKFKILIDRKNIYIHFLICTQMMQGMSYAIQTADLTLNEQKILKLHSEKYFKNIQNFGNCMSFITNASK